MADLTVTARCTQDGCDTCVELDVDGGVYDSGSGFVIDHSFSLPDGWWWGSKLRCPTHAAEYPWPEGTAR